MAGLHHRFKDAFEARSTRTQEASGSLDGSRGAGDGIGLPGSPLLTTAEAARYVRRFEGRPAAFTRFARRWNVPCVYVGRMRFYRRRELEAFLERNTGTIPRLTR